MDGMLHGAWDLPPACRNVILCADGILQWKPPTAALPLGRPELFHWLGRKLTAPCWLLGVKRAINDVRPQKGEGEFILKQNEFHSFKAKPTYTRAPAWGSPSGCPAFGQMCVQMVWTGFLGMTQRTRNVKYQTSGVSRWSCDAFGSALFTSLGGREW